MNRKATEEALADEIGAAPVAPDAPVDELAVLATGRGFGCDVLIADDTGASRELLAGILRNFVGQLNLREARNGTDALRMWRDFHPRITLLDIDMPGMDGLEALKQIRSEQPDAFVAMVSAGSSIETVKKALALGASGYVVKPYKPQRIVDLLAKYRAQTGHELGK